VEARFETIEESKSQSFSKPTIAPAIVGFLLKNPNPTGNGPINKQRNIEHRKMTDEN